MGDVILTVREDPTKKLSVEQYLWSIGKIFVAIGGQYLRHNNMGKLDFILGHHLATYLKQDPPTSIVFPISLSVIQSLNKLHHTRT